MADDFRERVVFEFDLTDATKATDLVKGLQRAVAETTSELPKLERGLGRLAGAQDRSGQSVRQANTAWDRQNRIYDDYLRHQDRATKSIDGLSSGSLPRLRYALYDVAASAGALGVAFIGLDVAILKTAIDFQRQFADVARTSGVTGDAFGALRKQFTDLAQTVPVAFSELTKIGSIAAQLNIGAESLAAFTSIVARFSATTNVSIEQSAMSLGRLAQLLPDVQGNYEALASSILKVGVNSIATESQIISIATQIAGIGSQSGLTADEVVGLSAALASVGIQPELSRGLVTRLFTNIQVAISQSGDRLEDFGRISGTTGAQFARTWEGDAGQALLDLLRGIQVNGGASVETLRALGIVSVRDLPALQKLAQNADLVAEAFGYSAEGMRDATEVALQYRVIAETVAAKIQQLQNNVQVLFDTIGGATTGPLAAFIDFLNQAVISIDAFASTDAGQVLSVIAVGLIGVVGVMATLIATASLAAASLAAVKTALDSVGVSAGFAAGAMNVLKVALISTGIGAAVVVIGSLVAAIAGASGAFDDASTTARKYFGDLTNLGTALRRDTEIYQRTGQAIYLIADAQNAAAGATRQATLAYGENAKAALASALAANESFQQLVTQIRDGDFGGLDAGALTRALLGPNPEAEATAYVQRFVESAKAEATRGFSGATNDSYAAILGIESRIEESFKPVFTLITVVSGAIQGQADAFYALQVASGAAGVGVDELTGHQVDLASALRDSIDAIFEVPNASRAAQDALAGIGTEFAEAGAAAAFSGKGVQDYISSVVDLYGPTPAAADAVQVLVNSLIASGYAASASAPELQYLNQVVALLGGSSSRRTTDLSSFARSIDRVGSSAASAAPQVRTLVDYANDLSGVFSRSFDIRFGSQLASDTIANSFANLSKRIDDARRSLQSLRSQRDILQYFLSTATRYGDTLRANQIRAELAELNEKIADTQADASTELEGNTVQARQNREAITSLLQQYRSYITALAASGADQATLNEAVRRSRAEFLSQASALGFAAPELAKYAVQFDGLSTAINNVPRAITVTGNADPAIQALNEFNAKLEATRQNAARGISFPTPHVPMARYQEYAINPSDRHIYRYGLETGALQGELIGTTFRKYIGTWAQGGYTGAGGKYEPAGIVHRGEYVVPKHGVNQATGLPRPEYISQLTRGSSGSGGGYAGGGYVRDSGPMLVELVAGDKQLLAGNGPTFLVLPDGRVLAEVVNSQNQMNALQGRN